ncbi:hypothetical protein E4U42_002465 [Claviceps africana]|uniref:DUF6594 domain-containing protein n=1 Tax=Claviceps africana TaxID=83212 RepID=A0A8K0JCP3_9HYPO|nr:hypothetical protein E4U42_002465 [Claviceps africana]
MPINFHVTEHSERDQEAFLTPENEVKDSSIQQDDTGADGTREPTEHATASCSNVQESAPHLETLSPHPSAHVPGKNCMTTFVEDCEEEDSRIHTEYTSVTSPTLVETTPIPDVQGNTVNTGKSEPYGPFHGDQSSRRQVEPSEILIQQSAQQNTSRRRPNVVDCVVFPGPASYPMPISRTSSSPSRGVSSEGQHWQSYDRLSANSYRVQPEAFYGYKVEERKQQMGCTSQQPSLRSVDKFLSVHGERGPEISHNRGFGKTWEQNGQPVPSSNHNMPGNDGRPDISTSQVYPDLASHPDNLAPSGYHLLATKLSGDACGQPISPIYRRFDALNHRLLLYMQEEINDLEHQLISLDVKNTANRSCGGYVMPASQRQDLAHQKTEILGLIGFKLSQYNHVLASYCKMQDLPKPTWEDIYMYKSYLFTNKLIVEDETCFLDASDLISLNTREQATDDLNTTPYGSTSTPKAAKEERFQGCLRDNGSAPSVRVDQGVAHKPDDALFVRLALSGTCVVLVPILIFSVMPSFVGRIAIILLVVLGVIIMVDQCGLLQDVERHRRNGILYFGLYCGAMTVLAGAVN